MSNVGSASGGTRKRLGSDELRSTSSHDDVFFAGEKVEAPYKGNYLHIFLFLFQHRRHYFIAIVVIRRCHDYHNRSIKKHSPHSYIRIGQIVQG